jgi:hypothetical protein
MPVGWTWVHYKVLELAYDQPALCELCLQQVYLGDFPPGMVDVVRATTVDETRSALADLIVAGAVHVLRSEFAAEGSFVRYEVLSLDEALAVVAHGPSWDEDNEESWRHEVVETDLAHALFAARPAELDPHRRARRVLDADGNDTYVEVDGAAS